MPIVFDVGAHIGETVNNYVKIFDEKVIVHAFEPFSDSFKELSLNTKQGSNVVLNNCALGARDQNKLLNVNPFSATNSFLDSDPLASDFWGEGLLETKRKIEVKVEKLDTYILRENIECIDILKLDTQGYESEVLKGAQEALKAGKIKNIVLELISIPTYKDQPPLHHMLEILNDYGFEFFHLDCHNGPSGQLRYMDGIFKRKNRLS